MLDLTLDSGGVIEAARTNVLIRPFEKAEFSASPANWKSIRGTWSLGLDGLRAKGNGEKKPQYFSNAYKSLWFWNARSTESTFTLSCSSPRCKAGHTVGFVEQGSSAGISRYVAVVAAVSGDLKASVFYAEETLNDDMVYTPIITDIDIADAVREASEAGVIQLRTESLGNQIALYVSDKQIICKTVPGLGDLRGSPAIYFQSKNASEGVRFSSYRIMASYRLTAPCYYDMDRGRHP